MAAKTRPYVYRDPAGLTKAQTVLVLLFLVTRLASAVWYGVFGDAAVYNADNDEVDAIQLVSALLDVSLLFAFVAWITGLVWVRRTNVNAHTLRKVDQGPVAAVVWYFVPLASLVLPYLGMREVWLASSPAGSGRKAPIVGVWWAAYLIHLIAFQVMSRAGMPPVGRIVCELLIVGAGVIYLVMIRRLSKMQEQAHASQVFSDQPTALGPLEAVQTV